MRKSYTITGESLVRPTNLPDGFEIEEAEKGVKEVISNGLGRRITITESDMNSDGHIKLEATGFNSTSVEAFLSRDVMVKIRDTFNEILGEGKSGLRKVVDASGYGDVWFEIEPNKFYNQNTREHAKRMAIRGASHRTLESITSAYGVDSITFE